MWIEVEGKRIFAATGGKDFDKAKPAILFIHGNACDHTNWSLQTRWFAYHGWSVLAVDLPGNGRSEGPMPESIEAMADWIPKLLDAVGVGKAALVGHSMGALIGLETAARYPERVKALSLLGFAYPMAVNPDLQALADAGDFKAVALMNDWMLARKSHIGGNRNPGTWLLGSSLRLNDKAPRAALALGFRCCNAYRNAEAAAAKIVCPVQILSGARDLMTPARAAAQFGKLLQAPRIDVLADCGHLMMHEKPDETLDALRAFLAAETVAA
ncbi:alpha/beta hydrolase [Ferrovibrio sp.]|uniref:alpha/beta fold hydrolase n=1 Tax=Ferrovibrio sp. TaxID=1917215 RepID=UPI0025BD5116|nr:alpha/beta hydrolase [Ferrovibrio sp.]MBX3455171.1 alpha/beta hydrolase [Ferrovibrio sp.]